MLSITDRSKGQSLAIFTLSLTAVLMAAAVAFDGGMMFLERRDQQNAADAAAIAGSRYLVKNTPQSRLDARNAAYEIATANGFKTGVNSAVVRAETPPWSGEFKGRPGFIEVQVTATRPSIFAGIMGVLNWPVSARAVALNGDGASGGFSILALDEVGCKALDVGGNGSMLAYGNIQVNSGCTDTTGAMRVQGTGDITVDIEGGACDVVGLINDGGNGKVNCVPNEGAPLLPDPLAGIPVPPVPALARVERVGGGPVPTGCPNSGNARSATMTAPNACVFNTNNAVWRLYPGAYPGGITLMKGTIYLEPGIYYIAGGGIKANSSGTSTISVERGGTTFCSSVAAPCGVMIYNTQIVGVTGGAAGDIHLNGATSTMMLHPLDDAPYEGIIIFQDRTLANQIEINGSASVADLRGTVYVSGGNVKVNGSSGQLNMDQIIAYTYAVNGAPGSQIKALVDKDFIYKLRAAGLVE